MPALTRGPLPARVYWVRRTVVLGVASLLVVGIANLLGGGSDASDPSDQASTVAAEVSAGTSSPSTPSLPDDQTASGTTRPDRPSGKKTSREPVLAEPDGPCADEDVVVTPQVEDAVAGRDVTVVLQLRTQEAEACTWRVARNSLTVKITSGRDDIWSSRECPRVIQMRDVVVRSAVTTEVSLVWNARRSDESCSNRTEWAMPGWYHVTAAALAGEPSDAQFELSTPVAGTITKTVTPSQKPSQQPSQRESGRPVTPSERPSKSPSGAVEPD